MRRGRQGIRAHVHVHVHGMLVRRRHPSSMAYTMRLDPAALVTPPYVWAADARAVCVLCVCKGGAPSDASFLLFRTRVHQIQTSTHTHARSRTVGPRLEFPFWRYCLIRDMNDGLKWLQGSPQSHTISRFVLSSNSAQSNVAASTFCLSNTLSVFCYLREPHRPCPGNDSYRRIHTDAYIKQ